MVRCNGTGNRCAVCNGAGTRIRFEDAVVAVEFLPVEAAGTAAADTVDNLAPDIVTVIVPTDAVACAPRHPNRLLHRSNKLANSGGCIPVRRRCRNCRRRQRS